MYGSTGYATNPYASYRAHAAAQILVPLVPFMPPVISLPMTVLNLAQKALFSVRRIVQGNYGYEMPFTLEDGMGNAVNLTNAGIVISVQNSQDPTQTVVFTGGLVVDNAPAGTCHYTVAAGNFINPGTFLAQITATWASEQLTWSGIKIVVSPALPKFIN